MKVRSMQYSGLSSNSAIASLSLPQRLRQALGPAQTSFAMRWSVARVSVLVSDTLTVVASSFSSSAAVALLECVNAGNSG